MNILPIGEAGIHLNAAPNYDEALEDLESRVQTGSSIATACQVFARTVVDASGENPDVERLRENFEAAKLHLQGKGIFTGAVEAHFSRAFVKEATEKVVKFVAGNPWIPPNATLGLDENACGFYSWKLVDDIMNLVLPIQEIAFKNMEEVGLLKVITKRAIEDHFYSSLSEFSKIAVNSSNVHSTKILSHLEDRLGGFLVERDHLNPLEALQLYSDSLVVAAPIYGKLDEQMQDLLENDRLDEAVKLLNRLSEIPNVRARSFNIFINTIAERFPLAEAIAIANKITDPTRRCYVVSNLYCHHALELLGQGLFDDALEMAQKIPDITIRQNTFQDIHKNPRVGTPFEISMSQSFNYRLDTTKPTFGG